MVMGFAVRIVSNSYVNLYFPFGHKLHKSLKPEARMQVCFIIPKMFLSLNPFVISQDMYHIGVFLSQGFSQYRGAIETLNILVVLYRYSVFANHKSETHAVYIL